MAFKDLREEVLENIKEALQCYELRGTEEAKEFEEDIEFWFDPEIVLYNSTLDSEDIEAASYEDLDPSDEYLGLFLSEDICKTYLSTRDFALVVAVSDGDKIPQLCIGVIDRSKGVALINTANILDPSSLQKFADIALRNATTKGEKTPIIRKYQRLSGTNTKLTAVQLDNAQRRLTSLLSEIDQYVLSRFVGKEIKSDEAL
jgi:hypothetical protein